jgi:hypothetical protein
LRYLRPMMSSRAMPEKTNPAQIADLVGRASLSSRRIHASHVPRPRSPHPSHACAKNIDLPLLLAADQ